MLSVRDRILALLAEHPEGLDDDDVAVRLKLARRQHANNACNALVTTGSIERRRVDGKLRNFSVGGSTAETSEPQVIPVASIAASTKPWCWEGNVVGAMSRHLTGAGWSIETVADTASKQAGADICARRGDEVLVVEVKGYPSAVYEYGPKAGQPKRTNPATQARHWVAEALMTALLRQSQFPAAQLAIAVPDFNVYRKLLGRLSRPLDLLQIRVYVVSEDDTVASLSSPPRSS